MRNKHVKISDFDVHETVGKGGFGRVRLCVPKTSGGAFNRGDADKLKNYGLVLKFMNKTKLLQSMGGVQGSVDSLQQEVTILAALEHPFMINLLTIFHDEKRVFVLYEFINGGELATVLKEEETVLRELNTLPFHKRKQKEQETKDQHDALRREHEANGYACCDSTEQFFVADIFLMFEYLHSKHVRVIYRDLKPENILIHYSGHLKLVDFGFAKVLETEKKYKTDTKCGTLEYQAPEVLLWKPYTITADWWAIGCCIYEIYVKRGPFSRWTSEFDIHQAILANNILWPKMPGPAKDLAQKCLAHRPADRSGSKAMPVHKVKKHAFFQNVDFRKQVKMETVAPYKPPVSGVLDTSRFNKYIESMEASESKLSKKDNRLWDEAISVMKENW
jgi:protein kinase A